MSRPFVKSRSWTLADFETVYRGHWRCAWMGCGKRATRRIDITDSAYPDDTDYPWRYYCNAHPLFIPAAPGETARWRLGL